MAAAAGALVLLALLLGEPWAGRVAIAIAVVSPPLLLALGSAGTRAPRRRLTPALLLVLLLAGSAGVVWPPGAAGVAAGLPPATWWMLIGLCALPGIAGSLAFAAAYRDSSGE